MSMRTHAPRLPSLGSSWYHEPTYESSLTASPLRKKNGYNSDVPTPTYLPDLPCATRIPATTSASSTECRLGVWHHSDTSKQFSSWSLIFFSLSSKSNR